MHQQKNKGRGKLSTPVSTTPKDSSKVEYNPSMQTLSFEDENGNNVTWTRNNFGGKPDGTYNGRSGRDKMFFNPNQNEGFIPYSRFKQGGTDIEGSTYLSPEDDARLKNLYEYARNKKTYIEPHYPGNNSIAERFWYWLKSLHRDKELTPNAPTFGEQMFKNGGKVEKAQRGQRPVYAKCGKKIKKGQFGIAGMPINPKVVKAVYDKVDNFLTPANKGEKEHGTSVIGGLGLPAYVSPVAQEIELAKVIGNRIPTQMSAEKTASYLIKAEAEKQKAIDAATKAGKIYIEPKTPADGDIDLSMFDSKFNVPDLNNTIKFDLPTFNSKFDIPDLNNIIKFNGPKFIGRNVLLPASGVVGSAAAGSYVATKKDKNKKSENKKSENK